MPGPSGRVGRGGERIIGSVTKGGGGADDAARRAADGAAGRGRGPLRERVTAFILCK